MTCEDFRRIQSVDPEDCDQATRLAVCAHYRSCDGCRLAFEEELAVVAAAFGMSAREVSETPGSDDFEAMCTADREEWQRRHEGTP